MSNTDDIMRLRREHEQMRRKRLKKQYKFTAWATKPRRWNNNRRRMGDVLFGVMQYRWRYNSRWIRDRLETAKSWRKRGLDTLP